MTKTDDAQTDIADVIAKVMKITGLNQKELGMYVGIRQANLSKWQSNKHDPRGPNLVRLRKGLLKMAGMNKFEEQSVALQKEAGRLIDGDKVIVHFAGHGGSEGTPAGGLISSFDPDDHRENNVFFDAYAPDPIDPEQHPARSDFPKDAIIELEARGGMGQGQHVQHVYRREGQEILTQDAIKDDYWRIPQAFLRGALNTSPARLIVLECEGDSMFPAIGPGERVFVDTAITQPSVDGIYAFRNRFENVVVKRLQASQSGLLKIKVISANPDYPAYDVEPDEITIIGRVVGSYKRW